jgi:hypothetical protein
MKATFEFNLPEDQPDFEAATNGYLYKQILWDLDNLLRAKLKYEDINDTEYSAYDSMRTELWNLLNERNLTLY